MLLCKLRDPYGYMTMRVIHICLSFLYIGKAILDELKGCVIYLMSMWHGLFKHIVLIMYNNSSYAVCLPIICLYILHTPIIILQPNSLKSTQMSPKQTSVYQHISRPEKISGRRHQALLKHQRSSWAPGDHLPNVTGSLRAAGLPIIKVAYPGMVKLLVN